MFKCALTSLSLGCGNIHKVRRPIASCFSVVIRLLKYHLSPAACETSALSSAQVQRSPAAITTQAMWSIFSECFTWMCLILPGTSAPLNKQLSYGISTGHRDGMCHQNSLVGKGWCSWPLSGPTPQFPFDSSFWRDLSRTRTPEEWGMRTHAFKSIFKATCHCWQLRLRTGSIG